MRGDAEWKITGLRMLFRYLTQLCKKAPKKIVLLIDEVDSASNNQVFLDFLAQLRALYLARKERTTFQSVILAGVYPAGIPSCHSAIQKIYDIKNLKQKIRPKEILFHGRQYSYERENPFINLGIMFGFLKNQNHTVMVANRIFEMKLYNIFLSEEETGDLEYYHQNKGYLLSFNFNQKKEIGMKVIAFQGKEIVEAVV